MENTDKILKYSSNIENATINSTEDNNSNFEISLKLSKKLNDSEIIRKFVIDTNDKYVKLRLNSKVNPPIALDASTDIIKE